MREYTVRIVGAVILLIGLTGILCAIAITPSFAERYLSPDNHITPRGLEMIGQYRLIAAIVGATMVVGGNALFLMAPTVAAYLEAAYLEDTPSTLIRRNDAVSTTRRRSITWGLIVLAGLGACLWMLWITNLGPGVSPDSVTYIDTARSLIGGEGFSAGGKPMTHYPPIYPILLSVVGVLHPGDMVQAARLLATVLFGVNVALLGLSVAICTKYSLSATLSMLLFALCSAPSLSAHSMALSEAPFIMFSIGAFILLSLHIAQSSRHSYVLASMFTSFAIATRYVGVTLLPPMALALLLLSDRPIKHRIRDTLLFCSVALLPLGLWLARNFVVAQTATNRTVAVNLVHLGHARALVGTFGHFIFPFAISSWGRGLSFVLGSALFFLGLALLYRKDIRRRVAPVALVFVSLCVVFCATYVAFLMISISFFDAHTPVNSRVLLPVLLPLAGAGVALARSLSRVLDRKIIWSSFVFMVLLATSLNGAVAFSNGVEFRRDGRGYTSRDWQESETLSYLATIPNDIKVYSNGHDVVRFLTEKAAVRIPVKTDPGTRRPNADYEDQLCEVVRESREGEAIIVYLDGITWRWYLPSVEELETKGAMPVLRRLEDGVIYGRD